MSSPQPNNDIAHFAASASDHATAADARQLYENKTIQDVISTDARANETEPALAAQMNKVLEAQIERDVKPVCSSAVLTKLIDSLCQSVIGQVTTETAPVAHRQAHYLSNTNAARVFTHSLCHILDDSLVWMDSAQVTSTTKSSFDNDRHQQQTLNNLSRVRRTANGDFYFSEYWHSLSLEEQIRWVVSAVGSYMQSCNSCPDHCRKICCDCISGCRKKKGQRSIDEEAAMAMVTGFVDIITRELGSHGGGSNNACSVQRICQTLRNCFSSSFKNTTASKLETNLSPAFITNWCVYDKTFKKGLRSVCKEQCGEDDKAADGEDSSKSKPDKDHCCPVDKCWDDFCSHVERH